MDTGIGDLSRSGVSFLFITVLAVFGPGSPVVFAHGVDETNTMKSSAPMPGSLWSFFIADLNAASQVKIRKKGDYRYIESDGLPDHATGKFPNAGNPHQIEAQSYEFRVPLKPEKRRSPTFIGMSAFGVALNGVPFDPTTTEYWNNDRASNWNLDAMGGGMDLGLDRNNAHVQPNGAYHYHGIPTALMESAAQFEKPVMLGYAADGFPIYGPWSYRVAGDMMSELVNLFPSYVLKEGERPAGPGGHFDGTYTADFYYKKGAGDLDQCNGREGRTPEYPEGTYYYVITDSFPFIPRCWMGSADDSFRKSPRPQKPPPPPPPEQKEEEDAAPEVERRKIDMRRHRPALDPVSACDGLRSGAFCSFRTRSLQVIKGTCRSDLAGLICKPIGY